MFGPHVSAINLFQIPVGLFKVKLLNLLSIRFQKHFDLERLLRIPRTKYLQYLNELAIYSVEYTGISKISSHYISIVLIFTFCFWMSPYCLINTLLHWMGIYHKTWANNTIKKNTVTEPSIKYNPRVPLHPNASGKIKNKNKSWYVFGKWIPYIHINSLLCSHSRNQQILLTESSVSSCEIIFKDMYVFDRCR